MISANKPLHLRKKKQRNAYLYAVYNTTCEASRYIKLFLRKIEAVSVAKLNKVSVGRIRPDNSSNALPAVSLTSPKARIKGFAAKGLEQTAAHYAVDTCDVQSYTETMSECDTLRD
jgi:hypothetical protein